MHVLITTHSFYNISPALVLVFNIFHKIVKAHHLALSLYFSLSLSLSLSQCVLLSKRRVLKKESLLRSATYKTNKQIPIQRLLHKRLHWLTEPYPFHLKSVILKCFISIHTLYKSSNLPIMGAICSTRLLSTQYNKGGNW